MKQRGFTLIELLVVIAIIAVLMGILMPALGRVRKQARMVACQAYLKQWGVIFKMYTDDNDGKFYDAWNATPKDPDKAGHVWIWALKDLYKDKAITYCPSAKKTSDTEPYWGGAEKAYGIFPDNDRRVTYRGLGGSYGINDWVGNPADVTIVHGEKSWYWAKPDVRNANNIPLFMDSRWLGGFPKDSDSAPQDRDIRTGGIGELERYCVDRHDGRVNILFVDFTVRPVRLKQLWRLKWHQRFDTKKYDTIKWPDWMAKIPD